MTHRKLKQLQPIVLRMAQVMADTAATHGACTEDDLAREGFTAAEIIEYACEARAHARTLRVAA